MTTYHIEKSQSEKEKALVIRLGEEAIIPKDKEFLENFPKKGNLIAIPYSKTEKALRLLAATGQLYLNGKNLVIDLFAKPTLFYRIENETVDGVIQAGSQEFSLQTCDFVCGGPPHWYVKGISLKFITTDISWRGVQALLQKTVSPDHLEEGIEVRQVGERPVVTTFPLLKLTDRSGAFANLWMRCKDKEWQYEPSKNPEEKGWEKDLLETGFIPKTVGKSQYYCPMDQVGKSLTFLLELGWSIQDWQGRKVVKENGTQIEIAEDRELLKVKGKINFEEYEADLNQVLGAFNRREKFLELRPGVVGLLPDKIPGDGVFDQGLFLPKSRVGSLDKIIAEGAKLSPAVKEFWEGLRDFKGVDEALPSPLFQGNLRPYQQKGVDWLQFLYQYHLQGILADDMGLGKTVQVLAFLSRLKLEKPLLIVLPTSLLFNWKKEFQRFLPHLQVLVHQGAERLTSAEELQKKQVVLTTYALLRIDKTLLAQVEWSFLILDEAQAIKNASTLTFQAACAMKADFKLCITGTPIENRLEELWAHFHFLMPTLLGSEKDFTAELHSGESDLRYLQRIQRKIRPFILRRKKEEVAKELPEKIEQIVWVEMEPAQRQAYETVLQGARRLVEEGGEVRQMEILEKLLRLRQMCCHPLLTGVEEAPSAKLEALLQDLQTVAAEKKKALVYSQFTTFLTLIKRELDALQIPYVYLDGSTQNREEVVSRFQTDRAIPLFLISLKAGGVGLNLTSADYVFLADPWWNEAAENQAIDRAHRIGRQEPVIAKRFVTLESVEEKMMTLKAHKRSLADTLFDDPSGGKALTSADLLFLLS